MFTDQVTRAQNSRVLQAFRAIGVVADDVPIVWYGMGKASFATASLGKSFAVYKCDKLTPVLVSPQLPKRIAALAVQPKKHLTFTACGRQIIVWKRVQRVKTLLGHKGSIKQMMTVGHLLFSLDDERDIKIWDLDTMELVDNLSFPVGFTPTVMLHPDTYLNKIVVGSEQGALQLWNIRKMKCIYEFKGWGSAVTALEQSPAVDVVSIGLADGRLMVHHLQLDQRVLDFKQDQQSGITSMSFRTDAGASTTPLVVSGSKSGDIAVWNLQTKRLESMITGAHDGAVVSLQFLANEPLLLSSGTDNSIKLWIFDHLNGGTARLLKSREGHHAPPTRIRYYGNNTLSTMADGADGTCCQILSAGQDRAFRVFHTAREQQSRELSQGPVLKKARNLNVRVEDLKLPPIVQFAAMETRARDWANVITCHENEIAAYVWRFENRAIGKKVLRQFDPSKRVPLGSAEDLRRKKTQATSVAISSCGNYALVGSLGGSIYRYNMQSGEARGSFPVAATPKPKIIRSLVLPGTDLSALQDDEADRTAADAHGGPVSAVAVDALNETVVSAGIDGKLKFWGFKKHELRFEIDVGSPISQMELHHDSNLLCVACDDQVLRLYDVTTHKLVRRFAGHSHRVTDMTFSSDARWLFSSSADASLRVWDIPTGKCVDWMRFQKPVTGLAVSPTGEFLATTHVGHVGIFLWANRSFFTEVFLDSEPAEPILMDMPVALNEVDNNDHLGFGTERNPQLSVSNVDEQRPNAAVEEGEESSEPLDASLITLSTAPRAFWQSLFNLELIKKRNKPIEPPKAPEQAPFFLQTARKDDVHPTFVPVEEKKPEKKDEEDVAMDGWGVGDDDGAWGDDDEEPEDEVAASTSRIVKTEGMVTTRCKLATLLAKAVKAEEAEDHTVSRFNEVAMYMQSLSASAVDVEMSTLCMGDFDEDGKKLLGWFLDFLREEMRTRRDFQVLQAYLNRFLKLHEELLVADSALLAQVDALGSVQQQQWQHLQKLLHNNLCLVQYLSKIQM
ncbi:WD repeat-containing protein 36 [Phytophthora citrophthora]|uniref:WD repeat-containing protein 36 n=1 Tax=Phytophthora citrophthora TaxID=4793 RepID=A0AAD9GXW6_9STRA|nr:WD repeat-containing protein 36 [Phytophthora citrophthora]